MASINLAKLIFQKQQENQDMEQFEKHLQKYCYIQVKFLIILDRGNVVALDSMRHFFKMRKSLRLQFNNEQEITQHKFWIQLAQRKEITTNIEFSEIWALCTQQSVQYLNIALEVLEDKEDSNSCPANVDETYKLTLGYIKDNAKKSPFFGQKQKVTTEGIVNNFFKSFKKHSNIQKLRQFSRKTQFFGVIQFRDLLPYSKQDLIQELQRLYLTVQKEDWRIGLSIILRTLNQIMIQGKNNSKLAQVLGVYTIHCSETYNQLMAETQGIEFLTEGLVPIQIARGLHEDKEIHNCYTIRDGKTIVSRIPSVRTWAKSWVPKRRYYRLGVLIPHGEAYSVQDNLSDPETGYSPSQNYVYDYIYWPKSSSGTYYPMPPQTILIQR